MYKDEDGSHFEAIAAGGSDDDGEDEEGKGETANQLPLYNVQCTYMEAG